VTRDRFAPDRRLGARWSRLQERLGADWAATLAASRAAGGVDPVHPEAVIPAAVVAALVDQLGLESVEEAMLLALAKARDLARPPVSSYRVGAVGLAAGSGDLVLGGNQELPGAGIWQTIHAEGAATLLARARGEPLSVLALVAARPCAHCRQVLAEIDGALGKPDGGGGLRLIDPDGRDLRLADLYPMAFSPGDLGMAGCVPGQEAWPGLALIDAAVPADTLEALLRAGRRSHAPYSGAPAAVVLRLGSGAMVPGSVLESVAFNPTIGPVQDALVGLLGAGLRPEDVTGAWLAVAREGAVGHEPAARDALASFATGVPLHVTYWA
jgi:cytidine deaminase